MINLSVIVSDVTALWQGLGTFYTEAIESIQTVKIINWDRMWTVENWEARVGDYTHRLNDTD